MGLEFPEEALDATALSSVPPPAMIFPEESMSKE
jgi:hypothetical protein